MIQSFSKDIRNLFIVLEFSFTKTIPSVILVKLDSGQWLSKNITGLVFSDKIFFWSQRAGESYEETDFRLNFRYEY